VRVGSRVLLIGGTSSGDVAIATTVWFQPASGSWTPGPSMRRARVKHAAVASPDGSVLVTGGAASVEGRERFSDTEMLRRGDVRFRQGPGLTDGRYKVGDAVAALPDGRFVVGGGPSLDIIDLAAGRTSALPVPGQSAGCRSRPSRRCPVAGCSLPAGTTTRSCRPPHSCRSRALSSAETPAR
jgi:hypothetical protein